MSKYVLHCDACGNNTVTDGGTEASYKLSSVPGKIPYYDPEQKKTIVSKNIPRAKMFKCTKCGRGVISRKNMVPIEELKKETPNETENLVNGRESSPLGREVSDDLAREFDKRCSEIPEQSNLPMQPPSVPKDPPGR